MMQSKKVQAIDLDGSARISISHPSSGKVIATVLVGVDGTQVLSGDESPEFSVSINLDHSDEKVTKVVLSDGVWSVMPIVKPVSGSNERILAFPISVDQVLQHLQQDMRDDWFEDVLHHADLFSDKKSLNEVLQEILVDGNGSYKASLRSVFDIPKNGLGMRYSLETDFYDRFIYQAICSYLITFYDPILSPRVLGHRFNRREKGGKKLFKGRIDLWQAFEGVTFTAFKNGQVLFATDLVNYFENITVKSIRTSFEDLLQHVTASGPEKVLIRNCIQTLCDLLAQWGFSESHGLPQNRDASSFIANVVLNVVDQKMSKLGYDYYRYVDDIRVICRDGQEARKAATVLIGLLRDVGMNINSAKTKILNSESSSSDLATFFPGSDDRTIAIDNMWRSRSRRTIVRSAKYIFQILKECIEKKETQSRQFRFAVNRLIRLVDADIFNIQDSVATDIKAMLIESLEVHAVSTDQYCRLLNVLELSSGDLDLIGDFLCDNDRSIHSWQNYHLWLLLARKKHKNQLLLNLCLNRIALDVLRPEVAAIFVYLRCVGEREQLNSVVTKFNSSWPYSHQRNFLLATSDFDKAVLAPVVQHLGPRLKGTAVRAKPYFVDDMPLTTRPRTPMHSMYDEISPYE